MKKVLVTGAAGFVGRHLTKHLLEKGWRVIAVDLVAPMTGGIDPEAGWPFYDPRDYKNFEFKKMDCRRWFKENHDTDFDYAFHLAAMVGGRLMIENMPLAVADDLSIDSEFWQWAERAKPEKTITFSSSAAYPIRYQRPEGYQLLTEDMIGFDDKLGMPDMSYGWAKLTSEYIGRLAYEKHGLKSVVYRPFSGYGEDQDDTYPFPSICKRILAAPVGAETFVWGSGRQMRDFIHIEDCVRGVLSTMDSIDDGSALNLSTGIFTSFIDFAKLCAEVSNKKLDIKAMSDKPEGVFARGGDPNLQKKFGFKAITPFRTGVENALNYFARS